ncbi:hypothetical protein EDD85DRAFT_783050 [Armillaria nabsnona]|nr:hypothetical protein EDD85DRAFT_783050 [Armillaria nabsnona]
MLREVRLVHREIQISMQARALYPTAEHSQENIQTLILRFLSQHYSALSTDPPRDSTHLVANFFFFVVMGVLVLVILDFEGMRRCCFSSDPGPEGSGLGYAKRDPREDLVDQEFRSRTYKKDKNGHIHMQTRSSREYLRDIEAFDRDEERKI